MGLGGWFQVQRGFGGGLCRGVTFKKVFKGLNYGVRVKPKSLECSRIDVWVLGHGVFSSLWFFSLLYLDFLYRACVSYKGNSKNLIVFKEILASLVSGAKRVPRWGWGQPWP